MPKEAVVYQEAHFRVLRLLEGNPQMNQRDLAAAAGVSAGQAEINWRRMGVRDWRSAPAGDAIVLQAQTLRASLKSPRPLSRWLTDLRLTLQNAGQWLGLTRDPAGQAVLEGAGGSVLTFDGARLPVNKPALENPRQRARRDPTTKFSSGEKKANAPEPNHDPTKGQPEANIYIR